MFSHLKWTKRKRSHVRDRTWTAIRLRDLIQRIESWYQVLILETILRQRALTPTEDGRHIALRSVHEGPLVDERTGHAYISNTIRSARYTVVDFLPKQLLFQATRLSNFYFICIGIPQAIPGISTTGTYTTILPLLFFILLTIAKEGYDDFRRHRLDRIENRRAAKVLRQGHTKPSTSDVTRSNNSRLISFPGNNKWSSKSIQEVSSQHVDDPNLRWSTTKWQDIKVGDIIKLVRDDSVPADVVLLYSSGDHGVAYVETMALDGETNLKSKQALESLMGCRTTIGIQSCNAEFVVEDPNSDLHSFQGRVSANGEPEIPLSLNNVLLRSSVLRNTDLVIALVVNTGEECKIRMNANHHPKAKKPRLEKYANQVVLVLVVYVILLTAGCSIGYVIWRRSTERNSVYLSTASVDMKAIIIGFAIEFNNVIPLALYVSLEIVKIGQMILIGFDIEMYDEASNTPMVCNTNTILENLGQVTHILSDKTGTLTENVMRFRKMSVAGFCWTIEEDPQENTNLSAKRVMEFAHANPNHWLSQRVVDFVLCMALCNTCLPENGEGDTVSFQASSPDEAALSQAAAYLGYQLSRRTSKHITLRIKFPDSQSEQRVYEILDVIEFSSNRKRMSIILRCPDNRIVLLCKGADNVLTDRLRHSDVAAEKREEIRESMEIEKQLRKSEQMASRPSDGTTDVAGRRSLNFFGKQRKESMNKVSNVPRDSRDLTSTTTLLEEKEQEFNINKLPKLGDSETYLTCFSHLNDFATDGLRTMLFCRRVIPEADYTAWKVKYRQAMTSLTNREVEIEAAGELVEHSLELLGASAIEDKLQLDVPETIDKLQRANIRIWMLTGDKRETAINIAHSAGICKPYSDNFTFDSAKGNVMSQLQECEQILKDSTGHFVAVVDGATLSEIEANYEKEQLFYTLIVSADSVICCRASPAQKANIVKAIEVHVPDALTLAIGDGANDIAMIQTAVSFLMMMNI
jgi:phospholipid-translocating ATPase